MEAVCSPSGTNHPPAYVAAEALKGLVAESIDIIWINVMTIWKTLLLTQQNTTISTQNHKYRGFLEALKVVPTPDYWRCFYS